LHDVIDWQTISSVTSAGCTVLLAGVTLLTVRSAERSARSAERSLQHGIKPVLIASHLDDRVERIAWGDDHWIKLGGGKAYVDVVGDVIYLAMSLRNVGPGLAVLHSWLPQPRHGDVWPRTEGVLRRPEVADFRAHTRMIYVPAGDLALWQGALRDPSEPLHKELRTLIADRERFDIDVIYSDHEGGQCSIGRFAVTPREVISSHDPSDNATWTVAMVRHWVLSEQRDLL
jgi:hypothetical protein